MRFKVLFVSLLIMLLVSCKKPVDVDSDIEREALENVVDVLNSANSSDANVQLAKIPDPDGIPILVGIDKSGKQKPFWVADPTDPTPFSQMAWAISHIFLKPGKILGIYSYDSIYKWILVSASDTLLELRWVSSSDTFKFRVIVDSTENFGSYGVHIRVARIEFYKSKNKIFEARYSSKIYSTGGFNPYNYDLSATYFIAGVGNFRITAWSEGEVEHVSGVANISTDSITVYYVCSDPLYRSVRSKRTGNVGFQFSGREFKVEFVVDTISFSSDARRNYRNIRGTLKDKNTGKNLGSLTGIQYEYDDSVYKSSCKIVFTTGEEFRLW